MKPERWRQVDQVFAAALELPESERPDFLSRISGSDHTLREEVEALLEADGQSGILLDEPIARLPQDTPDRTDFEPEEEVVLGPYRALRTLHRSLMATVYLATREDHLQGQLVAIKLLRQGYEEHQLRSRFDREQQILAHMRHPHIARLFDADTTPDGRPYLVMEYVEGVAIDVYCERHKLDVGERLELFRGVCAAVQYAHQNLLVHRDIKPSNVLVGDDGVPKLLDFGIAKSLHPQRFGAGHGELTSQGLRPMTLRYASPEQVLGQRVDIQSDIYSLGVLLYELLVGDIPYVLVSDTAYELEQAICEQSLDAPSRRAEPAVAGSLRGDLDNILLKALAKEPKERYSTVERFSDDVRRHLEDLPVSARPSSFRYEVQKFIRRHRAPVAVLSAVSALIAIFLVVLVLQNMRIIEEREVARRESLTAQRERGKAEQVQVFLIDLLRLANPVQSQGQEITASQMLDAGADRARKTLGGEPEVQATLFDALGRVYSDRGNYQLAVGLLEDAVSLRQEHLGPDHVLLADSLNQLTLIYLFQGRYQQAEDFSRQALQLWQSDAIDQPIEHMTALLNLGNALRLQGRSAEAVEYLERAIEIVGDHPAASQGFSYLGLALRDMGRFAEAEENLERAIQIVSLAMGDEHPLTAQHRMNLASVKNAVGQSEVAKALLEKSFEIFSRTVEPGHPLIAQAHWHLGRSHELTGDAVSALPHYRDALAMLRKRLGDTHPQVIEYRQGLISALEGFGLDDEAQALREAMAQPSDGGSVAELQASPGAANLLINRADLALKVSRQTRALEALRAEYPKGHWRVDEASSELGETLTRMGRFAEAEPLLVSGYQGLVDNLGSDDEKSQRGLRRLLELYQRSDRPQDVARVLGLPEDVEGLERHTPTSAADG